MILALLVALCGGAGATARFFLDGAIEDHVETSFPLGIVVINIAGSFGLGLVTGLLWYHHASSRVDALAGIGAMGGFTTWSTASWESVALLRARAHAQAALYIGGGLAGALAAGVAGIWLAGLA